MCVCFPTNVEIFSKLMALSVAEKHVILGQVIPWAFWVVKTQTYFFKNSKLILRFLPLSMFLTCSTSQAINCYNFLLFEITVLLHFQFYYLHFCFPFCTAIIFFTGYLESHNNIQYIYILYTYTGIYIYIYLRL